MLLIVTQGGKMDNIILGLLLLSSRTIYELRERINKGLNLMYSSSTGSIQAAIKKLLNLQYISYEEVTDNGKYKKIYSITDNGKQHFFEWINTPMDNFNTKNPELAKIYFMGFSDKNLRTKNIEHHLDFLSKQHSILAAICEDAKTIEIPEQGRDIFKYQLQAAQYGRDLLEFNLKWYGDLLNKIRSEHE